MNFLALLLIFWTSVFFVFYVYAGYPLVIYLMSRLRPRPVKKANVRPSVSLIIAAYNEEKTIRTKIENTLALSYPRDRLQIIVIADGSTDRTAEIVKEFQNHGVEMLYQPAREGKPAALNRAVPQTRGEILFFSDANTEYPADVVEKLVNNLADPSVGGVSGRKVVLPDSRRATTQGETAYWSYESALKTSESLLGSIVTADGEIFAMRRSLFDPIPRGTVHDDMYLSLKIQERGYRLVYEPEATSAEHSSWSLLDEFHLKVRYVSAGFQIMTLFRPTLLSKSWFALEFISHKVLRWLIPFFLLGSLLSSDFLPGRFYALVFWLQVVFYSMGLLGWVVHQKVRSSILYVPLYFSMANVAALYGFFKHFTVGQSTLWRKAER